MSDRIKGNNSPEAAHLQALNAQQHHTQQTVKSQKVQHTKMQQLRVRHNLMQAKFALNKKWAHNHAAAARGAAAQKVMARFGAKPTPKGAAGKGALRGKDKELHEKELPHDKELDKDLHEQQMPREREVQLPKEKEKERDKDRQPQQDQRQPDKEKQQNKERQPDRERQQEKERERQKDGEPQQNRNGNGGDDGHGSGQQQQQQPQQQSQQQSQQQPQQDGQQQQRQHKQREGKDGERGGSKFAVTGRSKISTFVKVPENFQALGAKLGHARATDTHRVLLQTFAKVILRHAAQLSGGFALAPLMVLAATSPGAMKRKPARMQSQIASAMFNQQRGATPAKASAGVGILSHTLDLTMARQRFGVGYSIDDQSMLSVRQMMIDVKASMPTLAASNGVTTASDTSPEVRVAPTAPGSQT